MWRDCQSDRSAGDVNDFADDRRALSPVVGKILEIGLVVLYLGVVTTALYGGVVPEYRAATGHELGERVLAHAAIQVEQAVPPTARTVEVRVRVSLPRTIAGAGYRIRADGRTLVLDHPGVEVGGRVRLALPERVVRVTGEWNSRDPAVVRVEHTPEGDGLVVELVRGER